MNVLSLFDGMSCGRLALQRAGIEVDKYFASEVDPYAIQIAKKNWPDTVHVGDVTQVSVLKSNLPKIDILIGGSPCQGFSFAGSQLNFEDPRSKLFFEFVRLLKETKPKYFFLENVKMKKESQDVISKYLGVEPILVNSELVSAQMRKRLYWTNIPGICQPEDKGILLKDIIQSGVVDREKSYCLDASYYKGTNLKLYLKKARRQIVLTEEETVLHNLYGGFKEKLPRVFNEKSPTIRTASGGGHIPSVYLRHYVEKTGIILKNRLLTPVECERLQTLPDGYTEGVSNTQRYKMIGNGWTVDAIAHFFQNIT